VFGSLRSKLIGAFALIIFLSLFLAGTAFVFLLREYQARLALNQLADLALPLSYQVDVLERAGADPAEIGRFLDEQAQEVHVRLLLVNGRGQVLADTGGTLVGQAIPAQTGRKLSPVRHTRWDTYRTPDGQELYFVASEPRPDRPALERFAGRTPSYGVVVAVPETSVAAGWWELAPMLSLAAALSLLVSTGVAVVLARSIAGPIAQITRASERMARGDYDQHILVRGHDEVGKLAESFNRMAREVARSHRTLKDFLVNVSHELRTPLTSIQGFAQAMADGTVLTPEEYAAAGQVVEEESNRMRRLVDDLLELSRLESGQVRMEREPMDLKELLRASVHRAQRWADEKGVSLGLEVGTLPPILGDGHWLEQVFANLLDNAVKHTPADGLVTVRAHSEPVGSSGQRGIVVEVHNTGSCIPPEDLPRVFERFYQVDRSRATVGTGLGLAIVQEIVQAHGGAVSARSDSAVGTAFVVALPAVEGAAAPEPGSPDGLTTGDGRRRGSS